MTVKSLIGPRPSNKDLSILIGTIRGHMSINSFLFKLNLTYSKYCRYCGENEENSIHFLCKYISLSGLKAKHFSKDEVDERGTGVIGLY